MIRLYILPQLGLYLPVSTLEFLCQRDLIQEIQAGAYVKYPGTVLDQGMVHSFRIRNFSQGSDLVNKAVIKKEVGFRSAGGPVYISVLSGQQCRDPALVGRNFSHTGIPQIPVI